MAEADINQAVAKMMESLDKGTFRPLQVRTWRHLEEHLTELSCLIQRNAYVCSVKCFDNKDVSAEQLQHCIERCQQPMAQVQNYMSQEMQTFQNRLQRCAMECQDRAKDSLSSQPSESQISAAQAGMEKCVSKCVDGHIKLLPTLKKRIEDTVSSAAH
ncbi:hypothetical protein DYB30_007378 [Aphanomyces astaci]|uniref:Protein FAM136A n=1 Tax=Aphanomyces astaci TaxID=112090 RepID=A0A397FJR9_APHAT|nr:hypothetical protein DYB36_007162 [Aphanomyces astaci]RHY36603.1 hypothetical protein DYB38_006922 [Aphanomyces astaci]RHY51934.1 hypothetical protein DYB30_007378 [Aphanomyces astaci]RHY62374.1 hypothetical protein DYB34_009555 [Aphanomyces astaci]RHZ30645.1 hypothetical protein DYB31_007020 [Aphanomyces astaci]